MKESKTQEDKVLIPVSLASRGAKLHSFAV
jgi:hypothetical protein